MSDEGKLSVPKWMVVLLWSVLFAALVQIGVLVSTITELKTNQRHIQLTIAELKQSLVAGTTFRYTSQDAQRDKELMIELIKAVNDRVNLAERRLEKLEDRKATL